MKTESTKSGIKQKVYQKLDPVLKLINKGKERSVKAKKNILASLIIKGISIGLSLVIVPITLHYINASVYGIWLTLISVVGWISFFDIGLTQGLRNRFAEAKAKENHELARIYVSTTYAILAIIFSVVWFIFVVVNSFLDWASILKVPPSFSSELSTLTVIVFTYFCLQFVLKIITSLILADQQPAKASLIEVLGQFASLIIIVILVYTTKGSLIKLGIAFCSAPILVLFAANYILFKGTFKKYRPAIRYVNFGYARDLFNLGLRFFIIQVAGIIQYQTANFIIARHFATSEVTNYNIVYKYFGMLNMLFAIFLTPFWSASTEAYLKNDITWIKKAIKSYNKLNILLFLTGLIMLFFSETIYTLWLGKGTVNISFMLSFWGLIYFTITMFATTYVFFLNSINALRIQFYACIISPVVYIGIALLLIQYYKLGVYSLFIASIIANFNGYLLSPLQYHMVVNKKKSGIWIK